MKTSMKYIGLVVGS